jgi:hypothetical protein
MTSAPLICRGKWDLLIYIPQIQFNRLNIHITETLICTKHKVKPCLPVPCSSFPCADARCQRPAHPSVEPPSSAEHLAVNHSGEISLDSLHKLKLRPRATTAKGRADADPSLKAAASWHSQPTTVRHHIFPLTLATPCTNGIGGLTRRQRKESDGRDISFTEARETGHTQNGRMV